MIEQGIRARCEWMAGNLKFWELRRSMEKIKRCVRRKETFEVVVKMIRCCWLMPAKLRKKREMKDDDKKRRKGAKLKVD